MITGGLTFTPCRVPTGPTAPSTIFLSARCLFCSLRGTALERDGCSQGARNSSSFCWLWRLFTRLGAIPLSSHLPLIGFPACRYTDDRRMRPFSSISRLHSLPDFCLTAISRVDCRALFPSCQNGRHGRSRERHLWRWRFW